MTQTGFVELASVHERPRRPRRRWVRAILGLALVMAVVGSAIAFGFYYFDKRPVWPSGGLYMFARVEFAVPLFSQGDPAWGGDLLARSPNHTIAMTGCAVTCAAMVMKSYGIDTNPGKLNAYLRDNGGFDENNDILWEGPPKVAPLVFHKAYEDLPSYFEIDYNLLKGNPVIVRVMLPSGITHFVVIMGKDGWDYLIRDPALAGIAKGVYPMKEMGVPIEALRYYERGPG